MQSTLPSMPDTAPALRRTKIVATLGPATDKSGVLETMIRAGVDVVRINFSHGNYTDHERRVALVREAAAACNTDVGILADLQGPKIRIGQFAMGSIVLEEEAAFALDTALDETAGTQEAVSVTYKDLPADVNVGDILLLNDGLIVLSVEQIADSRIHCRVISGGELSNNKGINRQGGGLTAPALTEKDHADIKTAAALGVDYLAVSFPRDAADIDLARELLQKAGGDAGIVAKIERAEAVTNLDDIVMASDAVMIARGDLAVEIGEAELASVQKQIIHRSRELNRVVITATQMMESMITQAAPTRAEVLDVANAVLDGTDAVMLSAETATGRHPVKVVQAMARVCRGAEKNRITLRSHHRIGGHFEHIDEAVAMATMYTANHLSVRAIVALTESGSTALWMSRIRSGIPIYAMTRREKTRRRVTLYRGVYPVAFDIVHSQPDKILADAMSLLKQRSAVDSGDMLIFTKGDFTGISGGTNSMKILRVEE